MRPRSAVAAAPESPLIRVLTTSTSSQAIDRFERDVERRVDADGNVAPVDVVVDGGRDADDRKPAAVQRVRASRGPVAANHDERVESSSSQGIQCPLLSGIGRKVRSASAAQKGAGRLDDAADIARAKLHEVVIRPRDVVVEDERLVGKVPRLGAG